jgi:hypothetical protein
MELTISRSINGKAFKAITPTTAADAFCRLHRFS